MYVCSFMASLLDIVDTDRSVDDEESPNVYCPSPYYDFVSATDLLIEKNDTFTILSLNIQSLQAKLNELKVYLESYSEKYIHFSAICIQETWLRNSFDLCLLQLEGYNLITGQNPCSSHGGIAIYLKNSFQYKILQHQGNGINWDGLFIEVSIDNSLTAKKLIIGNIYRPPRNSIQDYQLFITDIDKLLTAYNRLTTDVVIAGDFNINLLKINENTHANNFFELALASGYIPKITAPTRITHTSATLIDNYFVKLSNHFSKTTAGILEHNLSDHLPYFICLDFLRYKKKSIKHIKTYVSTLAAFENFKSEITNLCSLENFDMQYETDPNINYNILNDKLASALVAHLPCKVVRFNKYKHRKSKWITSGIIRSIKFRDKLYKKFHALPMTDHNYETLKINLATYNRILKKTIRAAKKSYYASCFEKYKDDIKKTWVTIKGLLNKSSGKVDFPTHFLVNDIPVVDHNKIAHEFNKYFVNIGPSLAEKIGQPVDKSYIDYLIDPCGTTFGFHYVKKEDILKIIKELKPKTSSGADGISNKLLKHIGNEIADILTLMINQMIHNGIFPEKLKIAKITPIFKKNENFLFENYRPISLLPSISKIFERIIFNQLHNYFETNNLYYNSQYGFRQKHSTELALLELIDRITLEMDKGNTPLNIYIDLSKAFDTIDHKTLLYKLNFYGVRNKALELFQSYLKDRCQYVEFESVLSEHMKITTGVPQGSILGPLLFIIYVNDLSKSSNMFHPIIYADDTTLMATLNIFNNSSEIINRELANVNDWFKLNKLSLNCNKTKAMVFYPPQKRISQPNLIINDQSINFEDNFDFLGITINKHLNWTTHVSKISKKISKTIGVMCRLKHFIPPSILLTIYNSLITPYLNYGLLSWAPRANKLLKLQKKAIRIITNSSFNSHTDPLFKELRLLKIIDICYLQEYKFCFKFQNRTLPTYFLNELITIQHDIHPYNTRGAGNYQFPGIRHSFAKQTLRYRIPLIYNTCPTCIKDKISTHSYQGFTKYVKQYLIQEKYNTICNDHHCFICNRP